MARDGSSDGDDKKLGWQVPWDQSFVVALDTNSGRQRWKTSRGLSRIAHGTPCVWDHGGRAELISEAGDVLQAFDIESGDLLWVSKVIGEGKVPSTIIGDGLVFTAGGWGGRESIKAFKPTGHGELGESNLVWEQRRGMPKIPSMIYQRPYLYALTDSGIVTCLVGGTGKVVWQKRLKGNYSASPVIAEGKLYLTSNKGLTTVLELGETPKILSQNPLDEPVQTSLAISQGSIFIRTEQALYRIGGNEKESSSKVSK